MLHVTSFKPFKPSFAFGEAIVQRVYVLLTWHLRKEVLLAPEDKARCT